MPTSYNHEAPRIQYVADGVQRRFAFGFPVQGAQDLRIDLNGAPNILPVAVTVLADGGHVDFAAAPPRDSKITLYRATALGRAGQFDDHGELAARALNAEFDRLTLAAQDLRQDLDRAARFAPGAPDGVAAELPMPQPRRALVWRADGMGLENSAFDPDGHAQAAMAARDAAIAARDATLPARDQALAARDAAQAARVGAEAARTGAETARTGAETARSDVETARATTLAARDESIAARNAAQSAHTGADAARHAAQTARDATLAARDETLTARDATLSARDTALSARDTTLVARDAAQTARVGAEAARTGAETARDAAIAAAGGGAVKISATDTTAGVLNDKIVTGAGLSKNRNNAGANETLSLALAAGGVAYGHIQNASAPAILLGRRADAGAGPLGEIALGANLSMAGNVLNAAGGTVLQTRVVTQSAWASLSQAMPFSDSVPQISQGAQIMSLWITPTRADSVLVFHFAAMVATNTGGSINAAIFRDPVASAVAAHSVYESIAGVMANLSFGHSEVSGSTVARSYTVRLGTTNGGYVISLNGTPSGRIFGGTAKAQFIIQEVMP